ncbi:MAG: phosphonate metabolism protein/1,5-bisphosphokinase (PRPP-forming) PhnN [Roseinatronobacter sp.]
MTGHRGSGLLVAIVGPSGVGKDTLIQKVGTLCPDYVLVRRVVTRPKDVGNEEHIAVSDALFDAQLAMGRYAFHWEAHGLRYAVPAAIDADLAGGKVVVFNGSRQALPRIAEAYPQLLTLMITATPEVLADRLRARGRDNAREIAQRLKRAELSPPPGAQVIVNDRTPEAACAEIIAAINRALQTV